MKRALLNVVLVLCGLVLGIAVCLLSGRFLGHGGPAPAVLKTAAPSVAPETACESSTLVDLSYQAAVYIQSGDFAALSALVHPEYGLTFSPYSNVNLSSARCFTAAEVAAFGTDPHTYVWGVYDGSGEAIELSVHDYFARFVFDRDFSQAPIIGIDQVVKSGNALENTADIFPGARFIELHDPGTDEAGLDWRTLRFVFESYEGAWRLSAIVHSEWTV